MPRGKPLLFQGKLEVLESLGHGLWMSRRLKEANVDHIYAMLIHPSLATPRGTSQADTLATVRCSHCDFDMVPSRPSSKVGGPACHHTLLPSFLWNAHFLVRGFKSPISHLQKTNICFRRWTEDRSCARGAVHQRLNIGQQAFN